MLDFVNDPEDIRKAFEPYYDRTELIMTSEPYRLDELKHDLDEMQVYHEDEVERFAQTFYLPPAQRRSDRHARLEATLQPAHGRFLELDEDTQIEFRDQLGAYVRLYSFISQIIPYGDSELELLASFGRALLPRLTISSEPVRIDGDVELEFYRLQQVSSGAITIDDDHDTAVKPPTDVNGSNDEATAPLSEIIDQLNDQFGTDFDEGDRLLLEQIKHAAISEDTIRQTALANDFDKFCIAVKERIVKLMVERLADNRDFINRCLDENDPGFGTAVIDGLLKDVFEALSEQDDESPDG